MPEDHEKAVFRAVSDRLFNATDAGQNVYVEYVPENKSRPYLLIQIQSAGERNFHLRKGDPEPVLMIKAVATSSSEALDIRQQAKALLDDQGEQDLGGLSGGADWYILKAKAEEMMSQTYMTGTTRIFEKNFQLRMTMEEK